MKTYAYYPGCSALKSARELDLSTRAVAKVLGIEWVMLDDAACCGSREAGGLEVEDEMLATALNARTFAMAEQAGASTIINICSTCHLRLKVDNQKLKHNRELSKRINRSLSKIGYEYRQSVEIEHFMYMLLNDIGVETLRSHVKRPLTGLHIAPFYGCHLIRPTKVHQNGEIPGKPEGLTRIIEALGGSKVSYSGETKCCGFHALLIKEKPALQLTGKHLLEAKEHHADLLVTPCPLCHTMLDTYQAKAERQIQAHLGLPVLHLPQLIGIAFGLSSEELGMNYLMNDPGVLETMLA